MEIITGRTGTPHVYAADDAEIYKLFLGNGDFLLTTGNKLMAAMNGTNEVRISDGSLMMQGRLAKIRPSDGFDSLSLDIGTTGYKRIDLVVAEYNQTVVSRQEEVEGEIVTITDKFDSVELKIVKGTPNANAYIEPTIITGDIDLGETHQVPLWAVRFDGINNDGLIDKRPALLDTSPIQTAISIATNAVSQVQAQMAQLNADVANFENALDASIYAYADSLREGISQGFKGRWRSVVSVANASSAVAVTMAQDYVYAVSDAVDVYLNGLRLIADEYNVTGSNNTINVTLTANTFTGQMEVVVTKITEEA